MNVLESAIQYGEAGFRSFPVHGVSGKKCSCGDPACSSKGKHPSINRWKHQASNQKAKLTELFKGQDSNLGIATGSGSKLVVIDVDPKNGGDDSYKALTKLYGPLDECTLTASTGGGGFHLYYRYEGNDIGNFNGSIFGAGIDIRGNGGYVVGAPSTHISGLEYSWRDGFYQPPELDSDLEKAILDHGAKRTPSSLNPEWRKADIIEGNRNHRLTQIAGHHRAHGHERSKIESLLLDHNSANCKPPLSNTEVAQIAKSVSRYSKGFSKQSWKAFWLSSMYTESSRLSHSEKGILTAVSFLMDDKGGNCIAPQDLIGIKAGCSRECVSRSLTKASIKGWIRITAHPKTNGGKGIFNSYLATIPNHNLND